MNFIEVKNVTKMFDNKAVLDNISLTVEEGEVLGILGRSGSGYQKTKGWIWNQ